MLMVICEVIFWILFIYGFLSLFQDIFNEITYRKINHDMKILIVTKNLEEKLEEFVNEFIFLKKNTVNRNVTIIDLTEKDNIDLIDKRLKSEEINWRFLNYNDGKDYVKKQIIEN